MDQTQGGLAECVGVVEAATFIQGALVVVGSPHELSLAKAQLIIKDEVAVKDFHPQDVVLLSSQGSELLLPPGVDLVVEDSRLTQADSTAKQLHVAIGDAQCIRGEAGGPQVEHSESGLSRSQTAQDQHQQRKRGGHVSREAVGERARHLHLQKHARLHPWMPRTKVRIRRNAILTCRSETFAHIFSPCCTLFKDPRISYRFDLQPAQSAALSMLRNAGWHNWSRFLENKTGQTRFILQM